MAVEWSDSAEKHHPIADGLPAPRNRVPFLERFDVARDGAGEIVDLVIGPDRTGRLLELLVHRRTPKTVYLMPQASPSSSAVPVRAAHRCPDCDGAARGVHRAA
jgi:hypothetical protein